MNKMQTQVREFHDAFGVPVNNKPVVSIDPKRLELRAKLILEEALETVKALGFYLADADGVNGESIQPILIPCDDYKFNLAEIADGLTDLKYVTFGADIELGLDAEKCFDCVHKSNMDKMWTREEIDDEAAFKVGLTSELIGNFPYGIPEGRRCFRVKRPDGKIVKPTSFVAPDLSSVISKQML